MASPRRTTHIGSGMYGDGEAIVEFSHVASRLGPPRAAIFCGSHYYGATLPSGTRPSVALAASLIARVRAAAADNV